jgi:hypothetical protein
VHWPWNLAAATIAALLAGTAAHAQTDEIQVYDAEINNPGEFSLQLHNNYTPIGRKFPDFPGGIVPNHTLNGVPEWAYGVVDWLELGYAPIGRREGCSQMSRLGSHYPSISRSAEGNRLVDRLSLLRGTEGSNSSPSSGESVANPTGLKRICRRRFIGIPFDLCAA